MCGIYEDSESFLVRDGIYAKLLGLKNWLSNMTRTYEEKNIFLILATKEPWK